MDIDIGVSDGFMMSFEQASRLHGSHKRIPKLEETSAGVSYPTVETWLRIADQAYGNPPVLNTGYV